MNARQAIRDAISAAHGIVAHYLDDLSDAELLVRPVPRANHIAWQLGHLITSEHDTMEMGCPGSMPSLPSGFREKYTRETASLDDPAAFHAKADYMRLYELQRAGTLRALDNLADDDLDRPAPEPLRGYLRTLGDLFSMQGSHALMHAGQWAIVRRKLGRQPLF